MNMIEIPGICGQIMKLQFGNTEGMFFAGLALFMWIMCALLCPEYLGKGRHRARFYFFSLITLIATVGVFVSGDLFTLFIFFEIMSFTSFVWVAHEETPGAMRAAYTYIGISVIGGLVTLMGLFMLYTDYPVSKYVTGGLIAFGFMVKAGVWPVHIWLPKAHPVAPAPASALLSGILTKTGIFGIMYVTVRIIGADTVWGNVLLTLGTITMLTGALLAMFSIDLKRTLACSSVSQIGIIVIGIGEYALKGEDEFGEAFGGFLSVTAAELHMVNHSMIKLVLFLAAGVIYMKTHKLDLNDIRGYGRHKPLLAVCFLMGALSLCGIPFTLGFTSKNAIHELLPPQLGWIFNIGSGMTISYMLKLFVAIFVEKNTDDETQRKYDAMKPYWNPASRLAVTVPAVVLFALGIFAMQRVPMGIMVYVEVLIPVAIGTILYFCVIRLLFMSRNADGSGSYADRWPARLDIENMLYRPLLLTVLPSVCGFVSAVVSQLTDTVVVTLRRTTHRQIATRINTGSMDDQIGYAAGTLADKLHPSKDGKSHIPAFMEQEERIAMTQSFISGSLSFGLIFVSIGLIFVMVYTLVSSL
ncbi:MAG: sodium:proton antiporter [Lachnospiraceae bacterium]|nr:sodium:proton antiporter [Lachnospiraceae bacterium]